MMREATAIRYASQCPKRREPGLEAGLSSFGTSASNKRLSLVMAEREGFEPPVERHSTVVFKTTAFSHSATSPAKYI